MAQRLNIIIASLFLACSLSVTAQQVDPAMNIPALPAFPSPLTAYPGLYNNVSPVPLNYVREWTPDQPTTQYDPNIKFRQSTEFFDGLGRPLQIVKKQGHSDGYDLIQHFHYDAVGRESFLYLPYTNQSSSGNYDAYSRSNIEFFYPLNHGQPPYGKTEYDNSPLNRKTKSLSSGKSWVGSGRGLEFSYDFNSDRHYSTLGVNPANIVTKGSFPRLTYNGSAVTYDGDYPNGKLSVTSIKDEDGNYSEKIHDINGNLLATRILARRTHGYSLSPFEPAEIFPLNFDYTFYIYDELDRLKVVLPPGAANADLNITVSGNTRTYNYTWNVTNAQLEGLAYKYNYDKIGRVIERKIPGKEIEYFVYDKRDRLVLTQDGKLRQSGNWHFKFYDRFDRVLTEGLIAISGTRADVQQQATPEVANPVTISMWQYYVRNYNPTSILELYPTSLSNATFLLYNYYDDYTKFSAAAFDAAKIPAATASEIVPSVLSNSVKGMLTGTKVRVLDVGSSPSTTMWLTTTNFYDKNGRLIQSHQNNHKGGTDIISKVYYYQGMPYRDVLHHTNPQSEPVPGASSALTALKIDTRYRRNIDHGGGNDKVWHIQQIINDAFVNNVGYYDYDHMDRLVVKQIGGAHVLNEYNIRGMLNNIHARSSSDQSKTFYKQTLHYDDGFASKLYNGNIAGITWSNFNTNNNDHKHAYGYSYDKVGRLTHAEYRNNFTAPNHWLKNTKDYTTSNITYDVRGNIQTMNHRGNLTSGPIDMDKLTYQYSPNSNSLIKVTDDVASSATVYLPDFKDNANLPVEYEYDENGNLLSDANKDAVTTYNSFNKPEQITMSNGSTISYVYDGTGNKLQKRIVDLDAGGVEEVWDYTGNLVYKDNVLQYVINEEGRSRPKAITAGNQQGSTGFVADYFVQDHLGNIRTTLTSTPSTIEYYAQHELVTANTEQLLFENIALVRDDKPGSINIDDTKAARLVGGDEERMIGTAIMLRVMPGDRFTLATDSYYEEEDMGEENSSAEEIVNSLLTTLAGGTMNGELFGETGNFEMLQGAVQQPEFGLTLQDILDNAYSDQEIAPKAGLTYLVLDEEFNLTASSGTIPIKSIPGIFSNINKDDLVVSFPGYLIVYVNNTQFGKDVWFDNVQIIHHNTEVIEENHYYPFGLTLSSTGFGVDQKHKYQAIELERNFGLETYETYFRGLNPQIGRWNGIDIKSEKYYSVSPYAAMMNNPVTYIDPMGDDTWVYGGNGVLGVHIVDNLPNQIHFVEGYQPDGFHGTISGDEATQWAQTIRAGSTAFIGANSIKSAKDLAMRSANVDRNEMPSGKEFAVYADVSSDREIIFKELPVSQEIKDMATSDGYNWGEAKKYYNENVGDIKKLFGLGHTHVEAWFNNPIERPLSEKSVEYSLRRYERPTPGHDYNTNGLRPYTPLFILSPVGLTIYNGYSTYSQESVHRYDGFKK